MVQRQGRGSRGMRLPSKASVVVVVPEAAAAVVVVVARATHHGPRDLSRNEARPEAADTAEAGPAPAAAGDHDLRLRLLHDVDRRRLLQVDRLRALHVDGLRARQVLHGRGDRKARRWRVLRRLLRPLLRRHLLHLLRHLLHLLRHLLHLLRNLLHLRLHLRRVALRALRPLLLRHLLLLRLLPLLLLLRLLRLLPLLLLRLPPRLRVDVAARALLHRGSTRDEKFFFSTRLELVPSHFGCAESLSAQDLLCYPHKQKRAGRQQFFSRKC